ncbi:MAG: hypothetical protein QM621_10235 [Aeromicrobium sp.]|uniref:hypothetical protein n=1 Tax=Aeromicrobium sp. TaxID=1871063 RepID=UPI0039E68C40
MAPLLTPSRDDLTTERDSILATVGLSYEELAERSARYQLDATTDRLFRRLTDIAYLLGDE